MAEGIDKWSVNASVSSLESMCSDGCPVSPSILYDQRALVTETRISQRSRNAMTAYCKRKSFALVGRGDLWSHQSQVDTQLKRVSQKREKAKTETRRIYRHFHLFPQSTPQTLAMISITI